MDKPEHKNLHRGSFLPKEVPKERWGLLTPAAIALALLLLIAFFVLRLVG